MINDIKLAQNGDTSAFARLYETVYKELYKTAYFALRCNEHDAADAVSDTVIDAFETIGKLKKPESFKQWIFSILSAKIKQKQKTYYNSESECLPADAAEDFSYASAELRQILETIAETDRLILSIAVLGGYTGEEIGKICGMEPSTVRSRLSRLKAALRVQLQD
ncbi:MAG: sigma-70 family RNA polymerase sigma factor [Oscillospiraceae bacterium]|nr:sigma-70 family RNA polymerase sigma factor [Oscillospiraceae bacterium]